MINKIKRKGSQSDKTKKITFLDILKTKKMVLDAALLNSAL